MIKIHLIVIFFSIYNFYFSQSNITWEVKITKPFDTTHVIIDSIPFVNNLKDGTFKSYDFFKKTGKAQLLTAIQYRADKAISDTRYGHGSGTEVVSYVNEIDSEGKWTIAKEYYGAILIKESLVLPNNRPINREYHRNGKLASEGRFKTYLSKHKGRYNDAIYLHKKIGLWKYYNNKGKRIYFFGKWRYK